MNIFGWSVNSQRGQQGTGRKLYYTCISRYSVESTKTGNCALLDYYTVCDRNPLPTFWFNLSIPSSSFKNTRSLETSVSKILCFVDPASR